jgi:hypothetical protein
MPHVQDLIDPLVAGDVADDATYERLVCLVSISGGGSVDAVSCCDCSTEKLINSSVVFDLIDETNNVGMQFGFIFC